MKNALKSLAIASVALMTTLTACKKNDREAEPKANPITTEELINYQIVARLVNPANSIPARLFHFAKSGDEVTATMDGVQSRRIKTVKVIDDHFTFDSDGDGRIIYEFKLKRDAQGLVIMDVAKYQNLNDPSIIMDNAVIWQSNFPSFKGKALQSMQAGNYTLKFTNDTWTFTAVNGVGAFYEIANGAWKGRLDNHDYLGFSFYQENARLSMALIRDDSGQIVPFQ